MTTHSFRERLHWSANQRNEAIWHQVYRKAFPTLTGLYAMHEASLTALAQAGMRIRPVDVLTLQRMGVDRVITFSHGAHITVDEKTRQREDTGDIALEFAHNYTDGRILPGWIEKPLAIDYLAYAFIPDAGARCCYLFDWRMLQRAWQTHKAEWIGAHQIIQANNRSNGAAWVTSCVCVPVAELRQAVSNAAVVQI